MRFVRLVVVRVEPGVVGALHRLDVDGHTGLHPVLVEVERQLPGELPAIALGLTQPVAEVIVELSHTPLLTVTVEGAAFLVLGDDPLCRLGVVDSAGAAQAGQDEEREKQTTHKSP
ncbi:MAG: hypothetical protein A2821_01520 [Candidatus Magasanikbacteria bacterium RIFCSPHIGHO2_01_FULL_41_23]|uniref:Uncharacterized protein n=1 Tax=Candidatus Magasanikbacteria bacterium RIFCSPLOWO2_01_FULL_40_15 TaxID=1798686 RepID=A0A1F6N4G1_9BACT|nr:MAG: hypothetical protein A2821_01520 [Candidatus Magasanikbacteria bacterium RIFCSPHIGHO2_01_FULL_41_23]OGH66799.1 MAG: hypothetical protein A3C66_01825 [Candidatus Magasanikbacteria bacterium RIFCSPHIGHO2_02_FULL_41_35]OGH76681.1 MAG: hypothetical protein A3F22_01100 [Candidatus Magasanikbacteria bacterium RIFCSPHIGHO2_12_FULL_41_16]OGH78886.1 MAG: hypothetical protein A2983_00980 [Candidatus Magasanikbacteria bacterium RIFCSPLOWO2_01_FULL_40_15]